MRTETVRSEIQRLMKQTPFRPFAITLENGQRIIIEHPENIAFDPPDEHSDGSLEFYVLTSDLRIFSTFEAVSSVALVDTGE